MGSEVIEGQGGGHSKFALVLHIPLHIMDAVVLYTQGGRREEEGGRYQTVSQQFVLLLLVLLLLLLLLLFLPLAHLNPLLLHIPKDRS